MGILDQILGLGIPDATATPEGLTDLSQSYMPGVMLDLSGAPRATPQAAPERGFMDKLEGGFDSPLTQFGLALLASSGRRGANLPGAIGEAGMNFQNLRAKTEEREMMKDYRKAQTLAMQEKVDATRRQAAGMQGLISMFAGNGDGGGEGGGGTAPDGTPLPRKVGLDLNDPRVLAFAFQAGEPGMKLVEQLRKANEPNTELGKLKADYEAGRITPADFNAAVMKATGMADRLPTGYRWNDPSDPSKGYSADPEWMKNEMALRRAGAANTSVTVMGDQAGEKELGEGAGKRVNAAVTYADEGRKNLGYLSAMRQVMETAQQGAGAETITKLKSIAKSAGMDLTAMGIPDNVSDTQLFQAMSNRLALGVREPGTGATSDRDLAIFQTTVPTLSKTREGNKLIADMYEKQIRKDIEFSRKAREINSRRDINAFEKDKMIGDLRDSMTQTSVIDDDMQKRINTLTGSAGNDNLTKGGNPRLDTPGFTPATGVGDLRNRSAGMPPNAPQGARKAPDGKVYIPDPGRPGKYLEWVQ